jgi:hypothetical protein
MIKLILLAMVLIPAAATPVLGSTPAPSTDALSQAAMVASLEPAQGLVQLRLADAPPDEWRTVTRRSLVAEGDWIRTGRVGLAYLRFFEGVETEILPNSMIQVTSMQMADDGALEISFDALVGDTLSRVEQSLDTTVRYELHTPSAVIAVRGTLFWTTATWQRETIVNALEGALGVTGVAPDGTPGTTVQVEKNTTVTTSPQGQLGPLGPIQALPGYPPQAPLAPETCGNGTCDPGEQNICALDCQTFPTCGDGICQLAGGEGPVTCPGDCVPAMPGADAAIPPDSTSPPVSGEPCTVQSSRADVRVRVGPGFNRGVRDYLPANRPFSVLGEATANDGSLWWRIDIPRFPEAWVAQSDVQSSGNCAQVGQAEIPPIVAPLPPTAPPSGPDDDGDDSGEIYISFVADRYTILYGQCVTISWDVRNIKEVYYEGEGVIGQGSRLECPISSRIYTLRVITQDEQTTYRYVDITVAYPY